MTLKGILIVFALIALGALALYWLRMLPSKTKAPESGNRSVLFKETKGERPDDEDR